MALPEQHQSKDFGSVQGSGLKKDSYKSKEVPGWKKIEVPASQNYKSRASGSQHGSS